MSIINTPSSSQSISQSAQYERFLKKLNRTTLFPVSPKRTKKVQVDRAAVEQELRELVRLNPDDVLPSVFPLVAQRINELVAIKRTWDKTERYEAAREYSGPDHVVGDGRGAVPLSGD